MLYRFNRDANWSGVSVHIKKGTLLEIDPEHENQEWVRFNPKTMKSVDGDFRERACMLRMEALTLEVDYTEVFYDL